MSPCESVRGEWGKPCPDCGQTLPARQGPFRSWMSSRSFVRDADDTQRRSHWGGMRLAPRSKHGLTPRQQQTLATLAKNGGVIAETARELRVTPAAIYITLARIRASGIAVTVHGLSPQEVAAP